MKWFIFSLLISSPTVAQQKVPDFSIILKDDSLIRVLKDYVHHVKSHNLQTNQVVLVLRLMWAHDDRSEWYFGSATEIEGLQKSPPVLVSQVEHYPVAVYFNNADINPFFTYSTDYLNYLEQTIYSKFKRKVDLSPLQRPSVWRVVFHKGEKTKVLVAL